MEVLLGMTLTPAVTDALLAPHLGPRAVVGAARAHRASKGKERAHLLLLYGTLCECVMVAEPRIRCVSGVVAASVTNDTPVQGNGVQGFTSCWRGARVVVICLIIVLYHSVTRTMSGSTKAPSLLSKLRGFIKPPWKVLFARTCTHIRLHSPRHGCNRSLDPQPTLTTCPAPPPPWNTACIHQGTWCAHLQGRWCTRNLTGAPHAKQSSRMQKPTSYTTSNTTVRVEHPATSTLHTTQYTARDPSHNRTMVYREVDPNAARAKLNKDKFTAEDKTVLKGLGFDYEKLSSTPKLPNATSIMDYPNNGYE